MIMTLRLAMLVLAVSLVPVAVAHAQSGDMTFFVTSAGSGKGADLGGLAGADQHCQSLAQAAGAGKHTWHAYLSTQAADGKPAVTAFPAGEDRTCKNWTSSSEGAAMVRHHDRQGLRDDDASKSWNSSHPSRGQGGGCSQDALRSTGGNGLFYCFATK